MGELKNIVTALHESTKRDYLSRMVDDKVHCMKIAKEYEADYWDGDRRYGYGGYIYMPGRWRSVAAELIKTYKLKSDSKVLDVGCGKGFLLYEMKMLVPELVVKGIDRSNHGLDNSKEEIKPFLVNHRVEDGLPFDDNEFDLVISLGALHNLRIFDLEKSLKEIERVSQKAYVMIESYRNEQELFNLQCWALTCESFFDSKEWPWIYDHFGYTGDYEFIYFE